MRLSFFFFFSSRLQHFHTTHLPYRFVSPLGSVNSICYRANRIGFGCFCFIVFLFLLPTNFGCFFFYFCSHFRSLTLIIRVTVSKSFQFFLFSSPNCLNEKCQTEWKKTQKKTQQKTTTTTKSNT